MLFFRPEIQSLKRQFKLEATDTPAMLQLRDALYSVADAQEALTRAEKSWNAQQMLDALRSAKFFVEDARRRLEKGIAERVKEV